jgi:hypothetical protein
VDWRHFEVWFKCAWKNEKKSCKEKSFKKDHFILKNGGKEKVTSIAIGPKIAKSAGSTWFSPRINIPSRATFKVNRAKIDPVAMRKKGLFLE